MDTNDNDSELQRARGEIKRLTERNDLLEKTIHVLQDKIREMLAELRR